MRVEIQDLGFVCVDGMAGWLDELGRLGGGVGWGWLALMSMGLWWLVCLVLVGGSVWLGYETVS